MAPLDFNNMSDEELAAIAGQQDSPPVGGAGQALNQVADAQSGLIETAGNTAVAASQGLAQGVKTAATKGQLLFRGVSDYLGITAANDTAKEADMLHKQQAETRASAEALGAPTVGKVAEFAGELAPNLIAGGAITGAAKGILGAGRLADVGASIASGAGTSLLAAGDASGAEQLRAAATGAAFGGVLSGVTNTLGAVMKKAQGGEFVVDAEKARAFSAAGIQPRPSQIASSEINPKVQKAWEGVENTLNKIPVLGIKTNTRNAAMKAQDYVKQVINEVDTGLPDPAPLFEAAKAGVKPTQAYALGGVQRVVNQAIKDKVSNPALLQNPTVAKYVEGLRDVKNMTFEELHMARQGIDDAMGTLKGNLADRATKADFNALAKIRGQMSDSLGAIARVNGVSKAWKTANQASQDKIVADSLKEAYTGATKAGGLVFDAAKFNSNLDKTLKYLKDDLRLDLPKQYETAIMNVKKLSDVFTASKVKPGLPGLSGNLQGIGGQALTAGAVGSFLAPGTTAVGAALTKGLSLMVTTKAGVDMISKVGKISGKNPRVRALAASALAIGQAADLHDQENQARASEPQTDFNQLSDQELEAIVNQGQ